MGNWGEKTLLIGVITSFVTSRGPHCRFRSHFSEGLGHESRVSFVSFFLAQKNCQMMKPNNLSSFFEGSGPKIFEKSMIFNLIGPFSWNSKEKNPPNAT